MYDIRVEREIDVSGGVLALPMGRLRWACRRGMLELDLLLSHYLEVKYSESPTDDKSRFIALLSFSDQTLFDFFWGNQLPEDQDLCRVVNAIRSTHSA